MIKFQLPCKDHVKHFLEFQFGKPAILRNDNYIGKYFFQLTRESSKNYDPHLRIDNYPALTEIKITQDLFLRSHCVLTEKNVREFNMFVSDNFKQQIRSDIITMVEFQGIEIKKAIECIYQKYNMDESILSYEAIKKDYYRTTHRPNVA